MSKITKATLKSFIRKNLSKLELRVDSKFNGQTDGIESRVDTFDPVHISEGNTAYTMGIQGVWVVTGSNNYFYPYAKDGYTGIAVSNCCGSFVLAVKD